jgi:hypothetical protein
MYSFVIVLAYAIPLGKAHTHTHTKGDLGEFYGRSKIPFPCIGSTEHTFGFTASVGKDALVSVSNLVHTRRSTFPFVLQVSDAVCFFVLLASEA